MKKIIFFMLFANILFANVTTITSGEVVSNSVIKGEIHHYKISVPTGKTVTILLDGLDNDADLHVRKGIEANGDTYDCKSTNGGTNRDSCSLTLTSDEDVFIRIYGFRATSYQVTATIKNTNVTTITSGEVVSNSVIQGEIHHYKISVSTGETVTILLDGLDNDADLHVRKGREAKGGTYDCKSTNGGTNSDSCSLTLTSDEDVFIRIYGFRATSYQVTATIQNDDGELLNVSDTVVEGETKFYTVSALAGQSINSILDGLSGDGDLYVRVGSKPTRSIYDCKSTNGTMISDSCSIFLSENNTVHIAVYGYRDTNYTLKVSAVNNEAIELTSGVALEGSVNRTETKFYKITGENGAIVESLISSLSADADLYIRVGEKPTLSEYDCSSRHGGTTNDSCSLTLNGNRDIYVAVYGFRAANYEIKVTLNMQEPNEDAKIFIIGDSTVHTTSEGEYGWGDKLYMYMKSPNNVYNYARAGASSKSFLVDSASHHDWSTVKSMMENADISHGAYLFIQFGHNDSKDDSRYTETGRGNSYYTYLKSYIDQSKALGVTPILVTSVNRFYKNKRTHGEYPVTMRYLAEDENVLLLDLEEKSFLEFNMYADHQAIRDYFSYSDRTHFNSAGATTVAGWIKELACDSADDTLCSQFN